MTQANLGTGGAEPYLLTDPHSHMAHSDPPALSDPQTLALDVLDPDVDACVTAVNGDEQRFTRHRRGCCLTLEAAGGRLSGGQPLQVSVGARGEDSRAHVVRRMIGVLQKANVLFRGFVY